jgi:predicted metal-dependent peptidase
MDDAIEIKLAAARTRLILDKPFLGALVLRLPMEAGSPKWCKTTATDARSFYYNRNYIEALSLDETQFVLAHEALHCALSHFARRQHRVKYRWDLACDLAINPLLVNDGLKAPPGALYIEQYEGMTAEEIYPLIGDMDQETLDDHLYDKDDSSLHGQDRQESGSEQGGSRGKREGQGQGSQELKKQENGSGEQPRQPDTQSEGGAAMPPPLTEDERQSLAIQWQQRLAGAAQQAMQAGKMSVGMARLVDHLLQPQLPWRMLLARYMTAMARDDYSFQRPSRREGAAILPSLRSTQVELVVILDSSGSINDTEIEEFVSEVDALKGQMRARVTLQACDERLSPEGPWVFEPWEDFSVPEAIAGGGGTSFIPPFEWLAGQDRDPDLVVYFTDAEGEFPRQAPHYPVIWLVKGRRPVPWGQRIQLN